MTHTDALRSAAMGMAAMSLAAVCFTEAKAQEVSNPYEDVAWDDVHYLHSMSHQHGGAGRWKALYDMHYRHFALSNYYPSAPTYPLPDSFTRNRQDIIAAPNAEHHRTTDFSLHFITLGSFYTTGYGWTRRGDAFEAEADEMPLEFKLDDLNIYDPSSEVPGEGVYRLDLSRSGAGSGHVQVGLTMTGAKKADRRSFDLVGDGRIEDMSFEGGGSDSIYFRVTEPEVAVRLSFDPETTRVSRLRVMQGANRPWRMAYEEALDGDRVDEDGRPVEGLQYEEGGGIVIPHPYSSSDNYHQMLDFDDRVLGIEVWNHRRRFGVESEPPHDRFYQHWDDILSTGRRCFGFFVKDHHYRGRGRNILLVPDPAKRSMDERERDALVAYRQGRFFGSMGSMATDEQGDVVNPYDYSEFYFTYIGVEEDADGEPNAIRVSVDGHDEDKQSNVQFRFITDEGIDHVVDGKREAAFTLPRDDAGKVARKYVRVEALAYPDTHNQGEPLSGAELSEMNIYDIARIHDHKGMPSSADNEVDPRGEEPISTVDMLFSQPIRFLRDQE